MAFPAFQKTKRQSHTAMIANARKIHGTVSGLRVKSLVGPTAIREYAQLQKALTGAIDAWVEHRATSGIQAYARNQWDNTIDWPTEVTAMMGAAISLRAWIHTNAAGESLVTRDANGVATDRTWTTAETAGFVTEADAFLLTIS